MHFRSSVGDLSRVNQWQIYCFFVEIVHSWTPKRCAVDLQMLGHMSWIYAVRGQTFNDSMSLLVCGMSKGLAMARASRREIDNVCVCGMLGQCVKRESCASVENLVGFARARTGGAFGPECSLRFRGLAVWCTSVSYPVVFDWSVDELQTCEGQTNICRVTNGVWHCVFHSVASFVAAVDMYWLEELRPDVGSG